MTAQIDEMILEMVELAEIYCERTGASLTFIGLAIVNDGKFFHDLKKAGKTCTIKTYRKVMRWFSENTVAKSHRKSRTPKTVNSIIV